MNISLSIEEIIKSSSDLRINAPLTQKEIQDFEISLPGKMPIEIKQLLEYASGLFIDGFGNIDFTGTLNVFDFKEIFPYGVPIANNDGDFWVVDITSEGNWQNVFFISHDPAVVLLQFSSIKEFLVSAITRKMVLLNARKITAQISLKPTLGISAIDARKSLDLDLKKFASKIPDSFEIFDLRSQSIGAGFVWGHNGPFTRCDRADSQLIFGVDKQVQKKSFLKGLFSRL